MRSARRPAERDRCPRRRPERGFPEKPRLRRYRRPGPQERPVAQLPERCDLGRRLSDRKPHPAPPSAYPDRRPRSQGPGPARVGAPARHRPGRSMTPHHQTFQMRDGECRSSKFSSCARPPDLAFWFPVPMDGTRLAGRVASVVEPGVALAAPGPPLHPKVPPADLPVAGPVSGAIGGGRRS
jgi:hypothetical protein